MRILDLKSNRNMLLVQLLGVFLVSRLLYDKIGITFFEDTYQYYWQFIHPSLLRNDLWRSVLYLHNQPPLLNVLTGITLQIFPARVQETFHLLYFLAGALLVASLYFLGVQLMFPGWLAFVVAGLFAISPSTIIYEHWLMYGYLIASMLSFSGVALYRFAESQRIRWGILFFSILALIALTWALFHFLWIVAIFVLMLCVFQDRKKVLLAASIPLLVVFGWYAKNLVIFGEFSAGTWSGMNLANMTLFRLPEKERLQMVKSGELSKFAAYPPFRNPAVYLELLPPASITGIPVLDITEFPDGVRNHHHKIYLDASNYYLQDSLYVIRTRPELYLRAVVQSSYIFFHSASDFELIRGIRQPIQRFDILWSRLFYGQWLHDEKPGERMTALSPLHVGWWIVAAFLIGIWGSSRYLWKNPEGLRTPAGLLLLFMMLNILYVAVVGNTMDMGENNRFRYVIDPFILLLAVSSLCDKNIH